MTAEEKAGLSERLEEVRQKVAAAAKAAGRKPEEITLIGVSKVFPPNMALAASELGLSDFGENRVQELLVKIDCLAAAGHFPNWHLIGTLQKNKVRMIIGRTHLIHSVDSLPLLQEIGQRSANAGLVTDVLLQVNTAGETSKHGFDPDGMLAVASSALKVQGVRLRGLMTMAPLFSDPQDTLPVFDRTRTIFRQLADQFGSSPQLLFDVLSMGMSHDFPQAIACGATHVRIGTAIFGRRL